jgi:histidinol-phosphatase (PHP family)
MIFQAHKGVSTENPENTMPAFEAAAEQGYKIIELDVSVTKDLKFVLLHDTSINRTARYENGDLITDTVNINDITYDEALKYDFGISFSKKFSGTKIPLLRDVLEFAKKNRINIKIDNKYQGFTDEQKKVFFELLRPYEDIACLTCSNVEEINFAIQFFPNMHFHYDGIVTSEILIRLSQILDREHLTVWLPHKNSNTSWVKCEFANKQLADSVKEYATLGIWILSTSSHLAEAESLGADIIETNGQLKPNLHNPSIADMHTHSESSHDSVCKIEDMCVSQIENGTKIFAVTDHFDTASFEDYDVFTPIKTAYDTVKELNKKYGERCQIMSGIEISEGFWYPKINKEAVNMLAYDVIIGSVHLVKYKDLTGPYSRIDFSSLPHEEIIRYLDAYFADVLTMLDTMDFDILAHLTCPLRYISGIYKIKLDMSIYGSSIEKILQKIIQKGIALEVNTSSFGMLNDFMPSRDILQKYHDMGGYLITLGSDAHVAKNASLYFGEAIDALKEIGFKNIYYYKNRKPYQIELGSCEK